MIKRNKAILCFCLVMLITLMSCCIVSATDNAEHNTTTTTTQEVNKNVQNTQQYNTIHETQSDDKTIEETDDQNVVKQTQNKTKAKTINKVNSSQQQTKTANLPNGGTSVSGNYELTSNMTLSSRISITGAFTLDGHGNSINITSGITNSPFYATGNTNKIIIQNVIFEKISCWTVLFFTEGCTDVTIRNCTFNNFAVSGSPNYYGPITLRKSKAIVEDCYFNYDDDNDHTAIELLGNTAYVSLCEVNMNGKSFKADNDDFYSGSSNPIPKVYTHNGAHALYMHLNNVEYVLLNQTQNFTLSLGTQESATRINPFYNQSAILNYTIYDPDGNVVKSEEKFCPGGYLDFNNTFNRTGKYTIHYTFINQGNSNLTNYYVVEGNKILGVYERSVLIPELVYYDENKATVRINLTNGTNNPPIANALITIKYGANTFTGYTDENGIVEINVTGLTVGTKPKVDIIYEGNDTQFIESSAVEDFELDLLTPLTIATSVTTSSPVEDFAGNTVTLTATIRDKDDNPLSDGSVTFSIDGTPLTSPVTFMGGVASCEYTVTTDNSVTVDVTYTDDDGVYASSSGTIVVNRLTIPTNLTFIDVPASVRVGEEFTFSVRLTNRTGEAVVGKSVNVIVNDVPIEGLLDSNNEGLVEVRFTPRNNDTLNIYANFTSGDVYYDSNVTSNVTISGSSISLMEPVINVYLHGNASMGEEYVFLVDVTANGEALDSSTMHVLQDVTHIETSDNATYNSTSKQWTIRFTPTAVRSYNFEFDYWGETGVTPATSRNISISVQKIPTVTNVIYAQDDGENLTLGVWFQDEHGNRIHEGIFHVNMNNSEAERQDYYLNNINDPSYKWPAEYDAQDDMYLIYLDPKFIRTDGKAPYAFVTYNGTEKYEKSSNLISEMEVKTEIDVRLNTYEDIAHTVPKNVFFINDTVNIYLELVNHFGFKQNGRFNITIANNKNPELAFKVSDEHSSNTLGYYREYHNMTSGEYTITVNYFGSGAYNPTTVTKTFTLLKLESNTVARVINNTAGNISLGVKVTGMTIDEHNSVPLRSGKLTVEVDGVPRVVTFNLPTTEDEVIINLNDLNLGITTTSEVPITITYQGNERYQSSEAIDASTIGDDLTPAPLSSINADKGISNISVTLDPEDTIIIDKNFDVYGYLTEIDGSPITTNNLNITILDSTGTIIESQNVSTRANGYYINTFTTTLEKYDEGTYTVNVTYYDEDHEIVNVTRTFTVRKETSNVTVTVENTTAGNITLRVKVTDDRGNPISEGKVNITDSSGNILYNDVELDSNGEALLEVTSITSNKEDFNYVVNYNGTSKYAPETYTGTISSSNISTRNVTINAQAGNDTYGDVTILVNITDTTTTEGIEGMVFIITDDEGNTIGTGKTGADGTVIVTLDEDLPVGENTLYAIFPYGNDTYTMNILEFTVDIQQRETSITARLDNKTAGNVTVEVTVSDNVNGSAVTSGTIIITDNGVVVANHTFSGDEDGVLLVPTNITDSGSYHDLVVTFTGNNVYADATFTDTSGELDLTVEPRNTILNVEQGNKTLGNTTVIVTILDEDGITGIVNGTVEISDSTGVIATGVTDSNGQVVIPVDLAYDADSLTIRYSGNTTYAGNITTLNNLEFDKRETLVDASLVNTTAGSVTVHVDVTDATTGEALTEGTIVVKDEDGNIVATVPVTDDNGYDVVTNITVSGDNKLTVEYVGTNVYDNSVFDDENNALVFNVEKRNASVTYEVVNDTLNDTSIRVTVLDSTNGSAISGGNIDVYNDSTFTNLVASGTTQADGSVLIDFDIPYDTSKLYVKYTGDNTYNENITEQDITIQPRSINVNASVTNKTAGNITVTVNITDAATGNNPEHGIINITSNGKVVASVDLSDIDETIATVNSDGTLTISTSLEEALRYTLGVNYYGNPYYEDEVFQTESFTATYKESNLTASIPNTTKGNTTLYVNLTDLVTGENINDVVYVSIDGAKKVAYTLTEGKLEELLDLPLGEHTVTITYNGDNKYNESTATVNIVVLPREIELGYTITNHTQGNVTIEVTVNDTETKEGINGTVFVKVGDKEVPVEIVGGVGTAVLDIPITGGDITVSYPADDTYGEVPATTPETVEVTARESSVTAVPGNKDAGNTSVIVTVEDPVTGEPITSGTIIVTDNGVEVACYDFNSPSGIVEVPTNITTNGIHKLNITFTGNENYTDSKYTDDTLSNIEIANRTASMTITPVNNTFNDTRINVTLVDTITGDAIPDGRVELYLEGVADPVGTGTTDENGTVTIKFNVPVDATSVTVKYLGNESNIGPVEDTYNFTVEKRDVNVDASVTNKTAGNVTVEVNITDISTGEKLTTGIVNITDSKGNVVATVDLSKPLDPSIASIGDDGTLIVYTNISETGNYKLTVTYDGQPNYDTNYDNTELFTVDAKESVLTVTVPEESRIKGNTTVNVTLRDPVTGEDLNGTVTVYVNDEPVDTIEVRDGKGGKLVDIPVGDNNIRVVFEGDNKYDSAEDETGSIIVAPRTAIVEATFTNSTQGNVTIQITAEDHETHQAINGTVEVTLPDDTIVEVPVTDGIGTMVLDIPMQPDNQPQSVGIKYIGDDTYPTRDYGTESVTVNQRNTTVKATVTSNVANKTVVTVNVTDPVTGQPVTSGHVLIKNSTGSVIGEADVGSDGTIEVPVDITTKGNYDLTVEFEGNINHTVNSTEITGVEIVGSTSEIVAQVSNSTQGNVTIDVILVDPVTGDEFPLDGETLTVKIGDNEPISVPVENGQIIVPLPVGPNDIIITFPGDDTFNKSEAQLSVDVDTREPSIIAEVTNQTAGNVTVNVNLTDATTGDRITEGVINITVGGEVVASVDLNNIDESIATILDDGTIDIVTNINKTGKYTLTVEFGENENYTGSYANLPAFDSTPKQSNITAIVPNVARGNTTVNVTLVDPVTGEPLNGTVYVSVNGSKPIPVEVKEGNGEIPVDMPIGPNNITVTFDGDTKYNETSYNFIVTVEPRNVTVKAEFINETVGNVTIKVTAVDNETGAGVNGTVSVELPNGTIVPVTIEDGEGTIVLDIPINGGQPQSVKVTYDADENYPETKMEGESLTLTVTKRESSITAELGSTTANNTTVIVTLRDPENDNPITSGTIIVTDNGIEVARIDFNDETGRVEVPTNITTSGTHKLNVTYLGNENYTSSNYTDNALSNIEIANRTASIIVEPGNSTFGNTTIDVTVVDSETGLPLPPGGKVEVYDGEKLVGQGEIGPDGKVTIPMDIPIGTNNVTVKYLGNTTSYNATQMVYEDIKLEQRQSNVVASVTNMTAGNITVKVNITDATNGTSITNGTVDITLNGRVVGTVDLSNSSVFDEDGLAVIYTNITTTGNYALVAKYSGNENYTGANTNIEAFDAIVKESNITAEITNTTKGNTTLSVLLKDPVTGTPLNGTVYVVINGQEPGRAYPVKDGVLEDDGLLDLPVGDNTVKVVFDGDKTYDNTSVEIPVTVEPRPIKVNATLTNTTVGNITLEVNVTDDETGAPVNGTVEVTLPNGTIVPVEVVNGTASVVLDIPISDATSGPLVVKFPADDEHEETIVETSNTLTISPRSSKVEAKPGNVTAGNTTVEVTVTDPVTGEPVTEGKVIVTLDGEPIGEADIGPDGTVTVPVTLPTHGDYTLNVTFKGSENYTDDTTIIEDMAVMGRESEVTVEVLNSTRGNTTLNITIKDPTTGEPLSGTVNITLPDGTIVPAEVTGGNLVKTLDIPYPGGNVTIKLPGDDVYNATSITIPVPIEKRSTNIGVNVTNTTAGNTTVKVNVTDSETGQPVNGGEVVVTVNGEEVGRLPVGPDGTVTIPTSIGSTGTYPIVVTYTGTDDQDTVTKQAETVTVLPKESNVTVQLTNNTRGNTSIIVNLQDPVTGTGLNGTVTVTLPNGTNMPVNVTNGEAVIPVDLPVGENTLRLTYLGNETYDSIHYDIPVNITKRDTTITSEVTNTTAGSLTFKTNVRDKTTGEPLTSGRVVAKVKGKTVGTAPLDKDGNAIIITDIAKSGDYDVILEYEGDTDYGTSNTTEEEIKVTPRQSNVTVDITNSTVGDTKVNITMIDPNTDKPINGEVIITLPNGTNVTATAENGNIVLPVDLPAGDNEITITYPGNDTYDDVVIKLPVRINKRGTSTTAKELTNTAGNVAVEVKVVDEATGEPITTGEVTISVDGKQVGKAPVRNGVAIVDTSIAKAGDYKLDVKYTGNSQYETSETNLEEKVDPRQVSVDVRVLNNTVSDTTFEVTVKDANTGSPVPNETVTVTLPNGTKLLVKTDANGRATIKTGVTSGNNAIKVDVEGNDVYKASTQTINTTIVKSKVTVTVDSVTGIIGEKIVLTAHLVDEFGKPVNGGNLVFKLNGRTLQNDGRFDTSTNKPMKLTVKNGIVTFTMTADLYLRAGKNITASYSGSYQYESVKANVAEANIKKRTATVTVTTSPKLVKQDKDVVFTASIKDVTGGSSKSMVNYDAYVIFKVNGKTLKDNKGENIKVKVTNGVAKYTYHVPRGTSGMIDGHKRDYMVTAVYANNNYYPDARDTIAYNVERSKTTINITSATVKNDKLSIKANILDQYGKNVIGKNQISIKINGKTFKVDGKSLTYTVKDGKISISGIKLGGNKVKSLTIVTGERQSYTESQVTTKNVKTL